MLFQFGASEAQEARCFLRVCRDHNEIFTLTFIVVLIEYGFEFEIQFQGEKNFQLATDSLGLRFLISLFTLCFRSLITLNKIKTFLNRS